MRCRFSELRCKEIINICDGSRLGYANDLEIDIGENCIKAIFIPGPARFFGLFGRGEDYVVPWNCIRKIGQDIILVEYEYNRPRPVKDKHRLFGFLG